MYDAKILQDPQSDQHPTTYSHLNAAQRGAVGGNIEENNCIHICTH